MGQALKYRKDHADMDLSVNDMIIRACALSLKEFPEVNASYHDEDTIYLWQDINVGIAVAVDAGLIVSVIENADRLDLPDLAKESKRVITLTRNGKQELSQPSRFTISNLGMYAVDQFTAIINPPEAAILAVSSIQKKPIVMEDGTIAARDMMNLTLSMDHRVNDGVVAASFVNAVKHLLENPQEL
jgi:pyruvate dehydrogenase E2 component (dihydrolipoamide acetyltransferase)